MQPVLCSGDAEGGDFDALGGHGSDFSYSEEGGADEAGVVAAGGTLDSADGLRDGMAASAPHANRHEGKRKGLRIAAGVTALLGILILMRHHAYAWYTRQVYNRILKSAGMSKDALQHMGDVTGYAIALQTTHCTC